MRGIKYRSPKEVISDWNLYKIEEVHKEFDNERVLYDINEIIEFYNINRYIDNEIYLPTWGEDYLIELSKFNKELKGRVGRFINKLSNEILEETYLACERNYRSDFFALINEYKIWTRISKENIVNLINLKEVYINDFLENKALVDRYGQEIRDYLIEYKRSFDVLLDKFVLNSRNNKEIYLPNELTLEDKEVIVKKYIESDNAHSSKLELISQCKKTKEFHLSKKIKYKATKKAEELRKELFKSGAACYTEYIVSASEEVDSSKYDISENKYTFYYSKKWIEDNTDYNTLLNNFITLFEYVDFNMRSMIIQKTSEFGALEMLTHFNSDSNYKMGYAFNVRDIISMVQMRSYYDLLEKIGIRLEEMISWFFKEYLLEEFSIENFTINIPSKESTYFEKCRFILPEMEFVLKQYELYVEEGEIEHGILQVSSEQLLYRNIKSLLKNKYAYPVGDEFAMITHLLFSDQCMLSYIERLTDKYSTFYDLLRNEEVYISDYDDRDRDEINLLIEEGCIELKEDGKIVRGNEHKLIVLKDLYETRFVNYNSYLREFKIVIDELDSRGWIKYEDALLSKKECDYINFYLNKVVFTNGPDLRNMYSHGTQQNPNDEYHRDNYMRILKIFILLIIKINDELCQKFS